MSSDAPLDPCRQWLGIDAADLGDHRRVLGVSPDERDPLAVLRAAEARLTRLRGVSAGSLEFVRAGFVRRVEAARESVLAEIAAAGQREDAAAFRAPPPPSTLAQKKAPAPPRVPAVAPPPVPMAVAPPAVEVPGNGGQPAPITIRTTIYRKKNPVVGVTLLMLGLTCLAGWLAYYALVLRPKQAGHGEQRIAARGGREAEQEADVAAPSAEKKSLASPPTAEPDRTAPRVRRRPRSTNEAAPSPVAAATNDVPMTPRPDARETTKSRIPVARAPEEAAREEARLLDITLAEVLVGIRNQRDSTVDKLLEASAGRIDSPTMRQRVAAWQQLAANYRRFLQDREAALDAVEPGASYDVQGQKVVIEKMDGEKCVFRASGPPKTVSREKIPAGIVLAILAKWSGDDPAGDLAIAAYQLVRQEPELRLAGEALEKGREAGADVEMLLPLLDDPVFTADSAAR